MDNDSPQLTVVSSLGGACLWSGTQRPSCSTSKRITAVQRDAWLAPTLSRTTRRVPFSLRSSSTRAYPTDKHPSSWSVDSPLSGNPSSPRCTW
eukprot:3175146-Prymnesium_polylepis.1